MFAALLDPLDSQGFHSTVNNLIAIATGKIETLGSEISILRLPQVHALNCLKDIMTHSRFRVITEGLLVEMLNIASSSLSSRVWAIQNCGLMLFRACISRITPASSVLHGDHVIRSQVGTIRTPLEVAIHLLQNKPVHKIVGDKAGSQPSKNEDFEVVFAALDLLSRLSNDSSSNEATNTLVMQQLSSKIWAIRERAALLIASRVLDSELFSSLETRLLLLGTVAAFNAIHGELLVCRFLFTRYRQILDSTTSKLKIRSLCILLAKIARDVIQDISNPICFGAFLDLVNDISVVSLNQNAFQGEGNILLEVIGEVRQSWGQNPSFILLSRALALHQVYVDIDWVIKNDSEKDPDIKFGINVHADRDVATFVITESIGNLLPRYFTGLKHALIDLILTTKSLDIQATATMGLARLPNSVWTTSRVSDLIAIAKKVSVTVATNRDLWNAQILLAARLIQALGHKKHYDSKLFMVFINALKVSQRDEIEMPTRNTAMEAVTEITQFMFDHLSEEFNRFDSDRLQLLLLLYDFLNDDDEEIRSQASLATHRLNADWHNQGQSIPFCTAAAREGLIQFLVDNFTTSCTLSAYACMKIIGVQSSTAFDGSDEIIHYCEKTTVDAIVGNLLRQATDLFAEERQNLYIDDIAEILRWADVVAQRDLGRLGDGVVYHLCRWTCNGLQYLRLLLESWQGKSDTVICDGGAVNNHSSKPLGLTYNAEILIVFIRVITMAGLLEEHVRRSRVKVSEETNAESHIERYLQSLQAVCIQLQTHEHVIVALERSLSNL